MLHLKTKLILTVALSLQLLALETKAENADCYVPGKCVDSDPIDNQDESYTVGKELAECHQLCNRNSDCIHFSFNERKKTCYLFKNCMKIDDSCKSCLSAERVCPPRICNEVGFCVGMELGVEESVYDTQACLKTTKKLGGRFYSFNREEMLCHVFSKCKQIIPTQTKYVSSELACTKGEQALVRKLVARASKVSPAAEPEPRRLNDGFE